MSNLHPKLKILCNLYDKSDESIDIYSLLKVSFFKDFYEILELLSKKQNVRFAYLCAKSVCYLINDNDIRKTADEYLELIEKWLENPNSDSDKKIIKNISNTSFDFACNYCENRASSRALYSVAYVAYTAYVDYNYHSRSYASSRHSVNAIGCNYKNRKEQEYKNLGLLVKVIKDG